MFFMYCHALVWIHIGGLYLLIAILFQLYLYSELYLVLVCGYTNYLKECICVCVCVCVHFTVPFFSFGQSLQISIWDVASQIPGPGFRVGSANGFRDGHLTVSV